MSELLRQPLADARVPKEAASPALRWGVLGASRIGRKVIPAIRKAGGEVACVGASASDRADAYARELGVSRACGDYQEVVDDPRVDAIYIPLANHLHFRWALACARAGKSCLCEKPMVLTADEAMQLREAFVQAGTRLVEGYMWRHHPQTAWLMGQLRRGEIGDLARVHGEFSFNLDRPDDYRWLDEAGGGSLWDLGGYCVNAARLFFGEEPKAASVTAAPAPGATRADVTAAGWLDFGQGRVATFQSSFVSAFRQSLVLTGTTGTIEVERPFMGVFDQPARCRRVTAFGTHEVLIPPDDAYARMIEHFHRAVADPSLALNPAEDGVAQARMMEALATSAANKGAPQVIGEA